MDEHICKILGCVSEQPARSSLDPWQELIQELRRRGRTYRDIAKILLNHCQLRVAPSTVFRFVHTRSKAAKKARSETRQLTGLRQITERAVPTFPERIRDESKSDEVQQRILALKSKPAPKEQTSKVFNYNPDEPLWLPKKFEGDKG
jgi:IS30 family transposase